MSPQSSILGPDAFSRTADSYLIFVIAVQDLALEVQVCRILQIGLCISAIINYARKGVGRVQITLLAELLEST